MEDLDKFKGWHFIFFLIAFLHPLSAQWERQTPLPFPPFSGESIAFATSTRGYIAGDPADGVLSPPGRMLETTDGGNTWHPINLNANNENMNSVFFLDNNLGWAVGNIGYKTTDGGNTWTQMNNLPGGSHYHIKFITQNFGWTVSNGGLCITQDGGDNWDYLGYNNGDMNAGTFLDENNGLAWTDYDLKKTTDGGNSWTTVFSAFSMPVAYILDINKAVIIAGNEIYYSTDGWATWTHAYTGSWSTSFSMRGIILNSTDIIIYNTQGDVLYTNDSGISWTPATVAAGSYSHLKIDASTVLLYSIGGSVLKTTDGGQSWVTQFIGSGLPIWSSTVRTTGEIWAVGNDGVIMKSTDTGDNWEYYSSGIAGTFYDIKFFDENAGLAVGLNGKTMKTTDAGLNWDPKIVAGNLQRVFMYDSLHAYVCGTNSLAKTTDQANTWTFMTNPAGSNVTLSDIFFVSPLEGWLVSEYWYGAIWHTTDGGSSWTQLYFTQGHPFQSIHMFDANLGYAVGPGDGVFKTTDGWQSHQWLSFANNAPGLIYDIEFVDNNTAWIVGEHGYIARSTDGCLTWTEQTFPTAGFNNDVKDIEIVSSSEAYAVTDEGDILHTTDAGSNWSVSTISGPIVSQWEGMAITPSGMWVSGNEVWYNGENTGPMLLLPVELVSFQANCENGQNHLQWEVAEEVNFDYYEVQSSTDGRMWYTLAKIKGNEKQFYEYSDIRKIQGAQRLYRLKMVDIDGSYEYSKITRTHCALPEKNLVSPNPVVRGQNIHIHEYETSQRWSLYNTLGDLIIQNQSGHLNTIDLQAGIYYLQIQQGTESRTEKILVQ